MLVMLDLGNALAIFYAVLFGIQLLYAVYILLRTVRVVGKKQAMIVERLGKFHKVCGPGFTFDPLYRLPKTVPLERRSHIEKQWLRLRSAARDFCSQAMDQ